MVADDDDLASAFLTAVSRNAPLIALLGRLRGLALPQGCVAGGCLFQTVWNDLHGFAPTHGIDDHDVFYFDAGDLSEDAEAAVAARVRSACADLPLVLDVRNQARVHCWYEAEFGAASAPFRSVREGIDQFLAPCCALGLHEDARGAREPYAPFGYDDLFALRVRPNGLRVAGGGGLAAAYGQKVARWKAVWPRLQVLPWPGHGA